MRKRMEELAKGKFEYEGPKVDFSENRIEITVVEGTDYHGSFTITSSNHVEMKGIVYASNVRIHLLNQQVEGISTTIEYLFNGKGLVEGDTQIGDFYFICNQGEYSLSFAAGISKYYEKTEMGTIRSAKQFVQLAKKSYESAYEIFTKPYFLNLFPELSESSALSRGLSYPNAPKRNMEEFLIEIGAKKPVTVEISCEEICICGLKETSSREILFKKNQWGYAAFTVTADAPFINVQRSHVTTDDFVGNSYSCVIVLNTQSLHGGKNYGRVTIESAYQNIRIPICVRVDKETEQPENFILGQKIKLNLWKNYVDYRLKKLPPATWANTTLQLLDQLADFDTDKERLTLYKAQVFFQSNRKQEADWILGEYKKKNHDKYSVSWGYYLYLTTLSSREKNYVHRITVKIEELYARHKEELLLFWILLFLKEDYEHHKARKLKAIEEEAMEKNSPILSVEAWHLIVQDPYLLHKIGEFECNLLLWAQKNQVLTLEVMLRVTQVQVNTKKFSKKLHRVLAEAYKLWPKEEILFAICSNLLRGSCYQKEVHNWYCLGIQGQLHLTNLYEAFLLSMPSIQNEVYPKEVFLYFQYKSNLPAKQKAAVYGRIVEHKEKQMNFYMNCRKEMVQFAQQQLMEKNMDENLALLYEDFFSQEEFTHETARLLAPVLFIHKLTCEQDSIKRVIVIHPQLETEKSYPLINHVAYLPIYSKNKKIFLEDKNGCRYTTTKGYDLQCLMQPTHFIKKALEQAPEQLGYLLYYFAEKSREALISVEELSYLNIYLGSDEISPLEKRRLRPMLLHYYYDTNASELLDEYLKTLDFTGLDSMNRVKAIELMIKRGFYQEAFRVLIAYGEQKIEPKMLVSVCTHMIELKEYEIDDHLLAFSSKVFAMGKYSETIVRYLVQYFSGTTKQMASLWKEAKKFELVTTELEERLLVQVVYTWELVENIDEIYASYRTSGGKKIVCDAYRSYFSFLYFMKGANLKPMLMKELEQEFVLGNPVNDCCKLALLKSYSENTLTEAEVEPAQALYDEFMARDMIFSFYEKLPSSVTVHFPMQDRIIIEYRSKPNRSILIHYCIVQEAENKYRTEEMRESYEGIYSKEVILFFGETLQYYITEQVDDVQTTTQSNQYRFTKIQSEQEKDRYDRINQMLSSQETGEEEELLQQWEEFCRNQKFSEDNFILL
ncbi:MAG: DUF5717 family protein [Lachnospiraceae bacterium]